jgi:hypothetical protein
MANLSLYDQTASMIADSLKNKNFNEICDYLDLLDNRIPISIHQRIYFHILRLRASCYIEHKRVLYTHYKHGFEDFPSLFIRYHSHNELEKIFPQHNVQKETFRFFDAIDGCFINFKTIPNLMEDLIYKSVDINIDIRNLIEIIKSHVDSTDINNSVLTGGIFSKYPDTDPYFDNKYEIFQSLKNEADCDVYIQDENKTNFEKYLKKFRKDYPNRPFAINCTNYKFNNFKIRTSDGLLLNFIFPSNGNSILNLIENFDFAICQIFYSFALYTLYFPISLFKIFHNFINKLLLSDTQIRNDIEMDNSLYKNLEIYYKDLEYYKNMCTIIKSEYGHLTKIQFQTEVLLSYDDLNPIEDSPIQIWLLLTFLDGRLKRILKYFYKKYLINNQLEVIKSPIKYFLEIFDQYLITHNYYATKDEIPRTRYRNDDLHNMLENQNADMKLKKVFIKCLYKYAKQI